MAALYAGQQVDRKMITGLGNCGVSNSQIGEHRLAVKADLQQARQGKKKLAISLILCYLSDLII